jgi:hypothetical protein
LADLTPKRGSSSRAAKFAAVEEALKAKRKARKRGVTPKADELSRQWLLDVFGDPDRQERAKTIEERVAVKQERAEFKKRIGEIQRLWFAGDKEKSFEQARLFYDEQRDSKQVGVFFARFCTLRMHDKDYALTVVAENFEKFKDPQFLTLLCMLYGIKGREDELLELTEKHFADPDLGGSALVAHGSALLRKTGQFDPSVELFHRAAEFGRLGGDQNPASVVLPNRDFEALADVADDPAQTPIQFLGSPPPGTKSVVCAAGDEPYFREFYPMYRDSFFEHNKTPERVLHFHIFDPSDALLEELAVLQNDAPNGRLRFSTEKTPLNKSYYYVGRFVQMPRLLKHYNCPIVVTDIDLVFRNSMDGMVKHCSEVDLGILEVLGHGGPWRNFKAGLMVFAATPMGYRFALMMRNFLLRMPREEYNYWYIDQTAILQCAFLNRNCGVGEVVPVNLPYRGLTFQFAGQSGRPEEKANRARRITQSPAEDEMTADEP